jgi:sugar/nucleoside kinase (ribokinase family)
LTIIFPAPNQLVTARHWEELVGLDLLCVGLTTLDILGRPIDAIPTDESGRLIDAIELTPAGTAGGAALVAAVLGLRTALISALGDDAPGRFVRTELAARGVQMHLTPTLPGARTSATILPIDSQGRRPTFHAVGASMRTELLPAHHAALAGTRFVHYAGIGAPKLDGGAGAAFLRAAKQAGAITSCDLIAPGSRTAAELQSLLPWLDCFMPSLAEARLLTGAETAHEAAAALLAMGAHACIVKRGAAGVLLATQDGMTEIPAFDVPVLDTTSCGDSFCAGFIAGRARGWDLPTSARCGTATAAFVAQGLGTLGELQNFSQVAALLGV